VVGTEFGVGVTGEKMKAIEEDHRILGTEMTEGGVVSWRKNKMIIEVGETMVCYGSVLST
jgi:hypothetical protein